MLLLSIVSDRLFHIKEQNKYSNFLLILLVKVGSPKGETTCKAMCSHYELHFVRGASWCFHFLGSSRSTKIILRQSVYVLKVLALHSRLHTEGSLNRGSFY